MSASLKVQLPPTTWEQRKPFYTDIESLLIPGFLSHNLELGGVQLALRSPSPGDLFLIRHRAGVHPTEESWLSWGVASCIWMLDGVVLLGDPASARHMLTFVQKLPVRVRNTLYRLFMQLFSRTGLATKGISAFCYEDYSRSLWLQVGQQSSLQESTTGVQGSASFGSNWVQRMWVAYNAVEDQRLQELSSWSHAKFVASAQNPKGVRQVTNREQTLADSRLATHQEEMDLFYYKCIGVVSEEDTLEDGRKVGRQKKSVPELQEEYRCWVDGELDQHDLIVQAWKENVRKKYEEERQHRESFWEQVSASATVEEDNELVVPSKVVGYDANQLSSILSARSNTRKIYESAAERQEHVYQAHLKRTSSTPTESVSLDEKISQRKSHLRTDLQE